MINAPLTRQYARKGKPVYLQRELPLGFGNRPPIQPNTHDHDYIDSNGFEDGISCVSFGYEQVFFNSDAALRYLECDPGVAVRSTYLFALP
ncbi:MAG: hypothetical protein H7319_04045 [Spirosoma sp.]|nr:hypothetical protein [Spirosoma sp.]